MTGISLNQMWAIKAVLRAANEYGFKEQDEKTGMYKSGNQFECTLNPAEREALAEVCSKL